MVDGARGARHVLLPRVTSGFAAVSSLFVATERASDLGSRGADVHVHNAAVGPARPHPLEDVVEVLGEQGGRQSLGHGVVQSNTFLEGADLESVEDRNEGLVVHDLRVRGHLNDGGLHEVARAVHDLAAAQDFAALLQRRGDGLLVLLDGLLGVQRAAEGLGIQGRADVHRPIGSDQLLQELVVDLLVEQHTALGRAPLTSRPHSPAHRHTTHGEETHAYPKRVARNAKSKSALSSTIIALFPPNSRI